MHTSLLDNLIHHEQASYLLQMTQAFMTIVAMVTAGCIIEMPLGIIGLALLAEEDLGLIGARHSGK